MTLYWFYPASFCPAPELHLSLFALKYPHRVFVLKSETLVIKGTIWKALNGIEEGLRLFHFIVHRSGYMWPTTDENSLNIKDRGAGNIIEKEERRKKTGKMRSRRPEGHVMEWGQDEKRHQPSQQAWLALQQSFRLGRCSHPQAAFI